MWTLVFQDRRGLVMIRATNPETLQTYDIGFPLPRSRGKSVKAWYESQGWIARDGGPKYQFSIVDYPLAA